MNKKDLVKEIAVFADISKTDAEKALNGFIDTIQKSVKAEEKVVIPGFGTFEIKHSSARAGINPATKEKIQIAARKSPKFKAGKAFKDFVK